MNETRPLFVGRQPIFTRLLEVHAYELLFRPSGTATSSGEGTFDEDRATSEVLVGACLELGLERIVGDRPAFVNLTKRFVHEAGLLPAGPDQIVVEILESVAADGETYAAVERLREEGYTIALDDFTFDMPTRSLLDLADVVKLDLRALTMDECAPLVEELIERGIEVLAEKIETVEEFEACKDLGFTYFQGYFLERPSTVAGKTVKSSRAQVLAVLAKLYQPHIDLERLQRAVSTDLALSYRILRHINSARYGLRHQVDSVRDAVLYLGIDRVRNLASLVLMASVDDKPNELIRTAMLRGRMCEILAQMKRRRRPEIDFTVGMFSCLDAIMDTSMDELVARLPLSPDVVSALTDRSGEAGELLRAVIAYEHGRWDEAVLRGLPEGAIGEAFASACEWVEQLSALERP